MLHFLLESALFFAFADAEDTVLVDGLLVDVLEFLLFEVDLFPVDVELPFELIEVDVFFSEESI